MGMELLMARARLNHLAAAVDIAFIDVCTRWDAGMGGTPTLGLPATAAVGDVVVAAICGPSSSLSTSGPSGSLNPVPDSAFVVSDSASGGVAAYVIRLSAADITAGAIYFAFTNGSSTSLQGLLFRNVSESPLGVAAAFAASSAGTPQPATFSDSGVTTLVDGCMLVTGGIVLDSPAVDFSPPPGYTLGDSEAPFIVRQVLGYMQQDTHGATGAQSMTYGSAGGANIGWAAWTLALRPVKPAITLSASFPSSTHVGETVSFDVIATLVDGATGTLTITASGLPAGLSIGSTSMVDSTHYKATVSGTLTTAQDVTATFGATGGSVTATPLTHEFNVTDASALQLIGTPTTYSVGVSSGYTFTVSNVQAGDQILVAAVHRMNSGSAAALTFTNSQSTASRTPGGYVDGGLVLQSAVMTVAAAGSINCTVGVPGAGSLYLVVYLYRGGTLMPDTGNEHGATMPRAAGKTPFALGNCVISSRGLALLFAYDGTFSAGTDAGIQLNNGAAFTLDADSTFVSTRHINVWHTMSSAAFSQSDLSIQTVTTADATILYNWAPYTY